MNGAWLPVWNLDHAASGDRLRCFWLGCEAIIYVALTKEQFFKAPRRALVQRLDDDNRTSLVVTSPGSLAMLKLKCILTMVVVRLWNIRGGWTA